MGITSNAALIVAICFAAIIVGRFLALVFMGVVEGALFAAASVAPRHRGTTHPVRVWAPVLRLRPALVSQLNPGVREPVAAAA